MGCKHVKAIYSQNLFCDVSTALKATVCGTIVVHWCLIKHNDMIK